MSVSADLSSEILDITADLEIVLRGEDGKSAYEVAVDNGFVGTEQEWLDSLKGEADRAEAYTQEAREYRNAAQSNAILAGNQANAARLVRDETQAIRDGFAPEVANAMAAIQAEKEEAEQKKLLVDEAAENAHLDRVQADADAEEVRYLLGRTIEEKNVATDAAERARIYSETAMTSSTAAAVSEANCAQMWEEFQQFPQNAEQYAIQAGTQAQAAAASATEAEGYKEDAEDLKLEIVGYRNETSMLCTQTGVYANQADASAQAAAASAQEAGASAELVTERIAQEVDSALESHLAGKLDVDGKAVDSAHADNADTVNNHTVLSDVPANAVFTDTTYQQMTSSELEDGISTQGRVIDAHTLATFILTVAADVVNNAPAALDTLAELAAALGDDPNFATTVMNAIGQKLDKAGGVVTGDLTVNGTITGNVTGNVSGNVTGSSGSCTGNAYSAKYLVNVQSRSLTKGTNPANTIFTRSSIVHDKLGTAEANRLNEWRNFIDTSGKSGNELLAYDFAEGSTSAAILGVYKEKGGDAYAKAPTPAVDDNSQKIATTEWVRTATGNTNLNAATASKAAQLTTARTIDGVSFDGTGNITHYGVCSTAAATVEKTVACTGFTLGTGARIEVKFTVTNTAANPTLNVNSTGGKAVYYRGAAISAGYLAAGRTYTFVYNGTQYDLIGDLNTDTNNATAQNISTANATYPILLGNRANATANIGNKAALFSSKAKLNASTAQMTLNGKVVPVVSSFNSTTGVLALVSSGS